MRDPNRSWGCRLLALHGGGYNGSYDLRIRIGAVDGSGPPEKLVDEPGMQRTAPELLIA